MPPEPGRHPAATLAGPSRRPPRRGGLALRAAWRLLAGAALALVVASVLPATRGGVASVDLGPLPIPGASGRARLERLAVAVADVRAAAGRATPEGTPRPDRLASR